MALLLGMSLLGTGCAGNGPAPAGTTSSFDTIQTTIFNVRCLSAGCHNSSDRAGDLVLTTGASYANLITVTPFNAAAQTRGLLRVTPGDPNHSFLLIKLTGPTSSDEGSPMPLTPPLLSAAQITLVREWILAGAPGSSVPTATSPPTPSLTPPPSPTWTPTPPDTATTTPSATLTPTPTITRSPTITPTGTLPPSFTPTPSQSPSPTQPPSPTQTPTATVTATASPSAIPTPTFSVASTFPQIQATIVNPTCLGLGCHSAADQAGGLVLEGSVAYANLVGPPPPTPFNAAASQAGMVRVDPGDPANSFLITKVTLPTAFDRQFGSRMPSGSPPLTADQIDDIRAWILRGALADEAPPAGN